MAMTRPIGQGEPSANAATSAAPAIPPPYWSAPTTAEALPAARLTEANAPATALAAMANGIPEMLFLGLLFTLGMLYRRNSGYHLRFLTCTGLIMLGPGLGRFLIAFCHLPFQYAIPLLILSTTGVGIAWLAVDIRNRRSAFPMAVYVAIGVLAFLIQANKFSEPWQQFAGWWASHFYH